MQPIRDYYEALAPTYDRDRFENSYGRYVDGMERALLRAWLRGREPGTVVDLACGTGRLLDFAMTGIDLSSARPRAWCRRSSRSGNTGNYVVSHGVNGVNGEHQNR